MPNEQGGLYFAYLKRNVVIITVRCLINKGRVSEIFVKFNKWGWGGEGFGGQNKRGGDRNFKKSFNIGNE